MINPADSSTRTDLAASDNIHFNNEGHRELFFRTVAKDVLGLTATAPLPVTIEQFNASITNTGVALKWTAHHDDPHSWFVVQRSVNGLPYESLAKIEVNNMGGGRKNYGYKDETAQSGTNFYRLEIHEAARTYYSAVLPVKIQSAGLVIKKIYPTRVISTLTLDVISPEVRSATLELFSSDGTRLKVLTRRLNRDKNTISIPVAGLSRGTYFVRISSPGIAPVTQSFQK
jgi:hypothetical protein